MSEKTQNSKHVKYSSTPWGTALTANSTSKYEMCELVGMVLTVSSCSGLNSSSFSAIKSTLLLTSFTLLCSGVEEFRNTHQKYTTSSLCAIRAGYLSSPPLPCFVPLTELSSASFPSSSSQPWIQCLCKPGTRAPSMPYSPPHLLSAAARTYSPLLGGHFPAAWQQVCHGGGDISTEQSSTDLHVKQPYALGGPPKGDSVEQGSLPVNTGQRN